MLSERTVLCFGSAPFTKPQSHDKFNFCLNLLPMKLILRFHNLIWVLEAVDGMDIALRLLPKRGKCRVNIPVYYIKPFHFTLFHFKPTKSFRLSGMICRHTSQIALVSSTERTLLILSSPNHQINSLCFSQTSSSGRDFDVTPWSERRMKESSFLLSKRSMATLTKPHCPSNPPEQAFPLFRNKFGCPQNILVLSQN